tara:strand:+ start:20113 stop:20367 length:255 start_codon:yes stop_codon:yes gene_type:complete
MSNDEIGGFIQIHGNGNPVMRVPQDKLNWFIETYKDVVGIPKYIHVDLMNDKFSLFPYPTNDWPIRYFASNNRQIHSSCFKCEK